MPESEGHKGFLGALNTFFTSLGGLLTSLAAVVGGVVAVIALVVGSNNDASGGGQGGSPGPGGVTTGQVEAGPTLAEWRSQANDVCAGADLTFELSAEAQANQALQVFEVGRQAITTFRTTTDGLRELSAPDGQASDVAEMISSWERGTEAFDGAMDDLQRGDVASYESGRTRTTTLFANGNRLAREFGATTCAETVFGEQ